MALAKYLIYGYFGFFWQKPLKSNHIKKKFFFFLIHVNFYCTKNSVQKIFELIIADQEIQVLKKT